MELTFLELQQRVAFLVAGNSTTTALATNLLNQVKYGINVALLELTNECPMVALTSEVTLTMVADQSDYDLPDRTVEVLRHTVYWVDTGDAIDFVTEQDWSRTEQHARDSERQRPRSYSIVNYNTTNKNFVMRMRPTPGSAEATKTVKLQVRLSPAEMTADADVPPLPENIHHYLVNGAVVHGFQEYLGDRQAAAFHQAQWEQGKRMAAKFKDPLKGARYPLRRSTPSGPRFRYPNVDIDLQ